MSLYKEYLDYLEKEKDIKMTMGESKLEVIKKKLDGLKELDHLFDLSIQQVKQLNKDLNKIEMTVKNDPSKVSMYNKIG